MFLIAGLQQCEKNQNSRLVWYVLTLLGNHYLLIDELNRSENLYQRAMDMVTSGSNNARQAFALYGLARINEKRRNFASAITQLTTAIDLTKSDGRHIGQKEFYETLVSVYQKNGQFKEAFQAQEK